MMITKHQPLVKKDIKKFTWKIDKFWNLKQSELNSYAFIAGRHKWMIHLRVKQYGIKFLSAYSYCGDSGEGLSEQPDFTLTLIDQLRGTSSVQICYTARIRDRKVNWGSHFVPMRHFSTKGFSVNGTLIIEAEVFTEAFASEAATYQTSDAIELSLTEPPRTGSLMAERSGYEMETILEEFFKMSMEEIFENYAFDKVEEIIMGIAENATEPIKKTVLKNMVSRLVEFKETIPNSLAMIETYSAIEAARRRKAKELEGLLIQNQKRTSHLESKVSRIREVEAKLESEIKALVALKDKMADGRNSAEAELEETNQEASRELVQLEHQLEKCKQAAEFKMRAKERVAHCNASWKLFQEYLG